MVFESGEMRWFFREQQAEILQWFMTRQLDFEPVQSRVDYYLPLPGRDDLGIKLREGQVEVKKRQGNGEVKRLNSRVAGYYERWTKWSFSLEGEDPLAAEIVREGKHGWIAVFKERAALLLSWKSGKLSLHSTDTGLERGCQVELTRIRVGHLHWHSFGFEWFGELEADMPSAVLAQITGNTRFQLGDSRGYAAFLNEEIR